MRSYQVIFLEEVHGFFKEIAIEDKAKIYTEIKCLETGDFNGLFIKTIYSPLKELKVKKYRILFFIFKSVIYIISAFIKKTQKTPRKEIARAQKIISLFLRKL